MKIINGPQKRAQKAVIYGPEGIGKTTFASKFPDPLFIDMEGGSSHLDVRRVEKPASWPEFLGILKEITTEKPCKTIVLDTADWTEQLIIDHVCTKYKQPSIEAFGYGKGYSYIGEEFSKMLITFDEAIKAGINVVVIAHAKMRKFEQPDEMGAYDRWEMKLTRQSAPLLKEWADMVLFLNYKTYIVSDNGKNKAQGGKRVMYTSHHPCWDAKNRHGLPDEMDLDYSNIAHIFDTNYKEAEKVKKASVEQISAIVDLHGMMLKADITEEQLLDLIVKRGKYPAGVQMIDLDESFVKNWCIKYFDKIVESIKGEVKNG